jgi:hypothetical protein
MPGCCVREHVYEEGGATRAAAVATCTQVLMHVVGPVGFTTLRCCIACRLQWHSRLDNLTAKLVGMLLGLMVVATRGKLVGLTIELLVGTLGIGACGCMERVICLLTLVWGIGNACCCLHPQNLLRVASIIQGSGFFKFVGICLYVSLYCINDTLSVLHSLRVLGIAHHSLDGFDTFSQCLHHLVSVCDGGIGDVFVLKRWTVSDSCLLLVCLM